MKEKLILQIERAFADVTHPGDDNLTYSTYGEEPEALKREFQGKTDWHVLDAAFLDQAPEGWASALSFFSDRALLFYLPAYMIADVRGELRTASPDARLCLPVTPPFESKKIASIWGGGTMGEWARNGFSLFSAEQVRVIVEYLWWKLDAYGYEDITISQALQHYWLDYWLDRLAG